MKNKIKSDTNYAFTLAEVLITLAIIGIVAALTLPTLIQSYKKNVVETRLAKFYSTINQAIQLSEIDNGDKVSWNIMDVIIEDGTYKQEGITAQEWYNKYLSKYIKVLKAEPSQTIEQKFNIYFLDGSMVTFAGSSWNFYPDAKDYKEHEVVDGDNSYIDRNRDTVGQKSFTFYFRPYDSGNKYTYKKGVEPYLSSAFSGTNAELKNNSALGCNKNATNEPAYCTELIRRNGWKIPNDYPFKF